MSKTTFDIRDIMAMLPHRQPFLLVDRVIDYVPGESLVAIKNVTYNEPFFTGHFPQVPTMPGVLIIEALAQACGLLIAIDTGIRPDSGMIFYFAGIEDARFKRIVEPGDQLRFEVSLDKAKRHLRRFKTRAMVGTELACEATLMCVMKDTSRSAPNSATAE
ncbi:MAG: 3-hydroxyacyl-ACP dehydratase FabZ [Nevskia sp.]|nr:3-hydroxyacyl-ACP dehydratase FabZ [Nevskia sp.]